MTRLAATFALAAACAALIAPASQAANPQIAGVQVALRAHGLYLGPIDGVAGPMTRAAVQAFQRKKGLRVDGLAGPRTRVALGPLGRPLLGKRMLKPGAFGLDVAVVQFLLMRERLYDGALDGYFGPETAAALRKYQRRTGLSADAVVGPRTLTSFTRRSGLPARRPPVTSTRTHLVRVGDTLAEIAARHGTNARALARLNGLKNPNLVRIGARLRLPSAAAAPSTPPGAVRSLLDTWAAKNGLDASLVRALAWMESGYQPNVTSSVGAWGVMQIIPTTWEYVETVLLGRRVPRTTEGNIRVGTALLRHLLKRFDGNERLALAAWYQGERAVRERGVLKVSEQFVANVLALRKRGV